MMLGLPKCYQSLCSPFSLLSEFKKKYLFFRLISTEEGRVFPIIRQTNLEDEHLRSAAMEKFKYGTPRHLCSKIHGAPKMKKIVEIITFMINGGHPNKKSIYVL